MPTPYSAAWLCLYDLLHGELNQPYWIETRKNWRLGAAIQSLKYLGWPINSTMDYCSGREHKVAWYKLHDDALAVAKRKFGGTE